MRRATDKNRIKKEQESHAEDWERWWQKKREQKREEKMREEKHVMEK